MDDPPVDRGEDRLEHEARLGEKIPIREPKLFDPALIQVRGPLAIVLLVRILAMLRAVELDREARLCAVEVEDVRTERVLASELEATQATGTELAPHLPLGVGRFGA
jgi:hypothetical protein